MTTETSTITFDMKDSKHQIPPLHLPRTLPMSSVSVRIASHVYPYFGMHQARRWTCILQGPSGGVLTGRAKDEYQFTVTPPLESPRH